MPQSLSRILVHLVFSTKSRRPWITPEVSAQLHPYLVRVLQSEGCTPIQVGGVEDHIHALFGLSRTNAIAKVVEHLKTSSSGWVKRTFAEAKEFSWQAGYGALSVGSDGEAACVQYIQNQREHHRRKTFQDEFRELMQLAGLEIDERYAWD